MHTVTFLETLVHFDSHTGFRTYVLPFVPDSIMTFQQTADSRYKGTCQAHTITKHVTKTWGPASRGEQTSMFRTRGNVPVEASNEALRDIADRLSQFVTRGHQMGGKVFKKDKRPCKTIDAAKAAWKPAIDLKSTEAGIKKTHSILKRYVDRGSRKRAKKNTAKGKNKKAKVDEDESEEETPPAAEAWTVSPRMTRTRMMKDLRVTAAVSLTTSPVVSLLRPKSMTAHEKMNFRGRMIHGKSRGRYGRMKSRG